MRVDASTCPFCSGALALDPTPPALPTRRLGRAAFVAFGATVATAAVVACGNGKPPADGSNAGASSSASSESTGAGTGAATGTGAKTTETTTATATTSYPTVPNNKPYGAPPADGMLV